MTLQQLKYVVKVAQIGNITQATQELFVTQPSLTKAIKELEKEMDICIFERSTKGIKTTQEGEEFLRYANQVLEQANLLESQYKKPEQKKQSLTVSTQHYSFAVRAFVDFIKSQKTDEYDFFFREERTKDIIDDVASLKSEIGIIYYNDFNHDVLFKLLKLNDLNFTELFVAKPNVFISRTNPLACRKSVTMEDLLPYPYLSFEQGENNSFYFSEEIFSTLVRPKNIHVQDRATLFNLLIGLNGYTVSSGIIDKEMDESIVAVPLDLEGNMHIGYITNNKVLGSKNLKDFISHLENNCHNFKL